VLGVNKEQFDNERRYQSAVSIARTMLRTGIITENEYKVIDTMFLEKYRPVLGALSAEKTPKSVDFTPFQSVNG
jgi:hypothetical protein